ncbi:MAG: hypothetical protein AMDU4_FER2C00238G0034 [Ferroplasma sp. Type II]|uniref:GNAT family N-acetyltransferase n=1 Tax=Ferroplasma sp. Type II TaxID=261388 RepID=UPI00038953B3|nr:GNAT family N-acetyltransferase [Ferroplasma sp. Type II]EQB70601.1 MAG: hypothetical protein AMDU4_FER2C00238G0034 [Ferroplasma sp. Type II]
MIRKANPGDWNSVSHISSTAGYDDYINTHYGPSYLNSGNVYVSDNSGIDGFIKIEALKDNSLWFSGLRVSQESRRKHIATTMLEYTHKCAMKNGYNSMRCMVETNNIPSIKLMESFSMSIVQKYDFFLGGIDISSYTFNQKLKHGLVNKEWKFDSEYKGIYEIGNNQIYAYPGNLTYYTVLEGADFDYVPEGSTCVPDYLSSFIKLKPDSEFVSGYVFEKKIWNNKIHNFS